MNHWLTYVVLAGLCWGTYVPLIAFGGKELKSRYGAFLCVGLAYVVIAVVFPLARFWLGQEKVDWKPTGITFASLAGVAGALGALCVIFATAVAKPGDRIYIAPLIFALAPVINTLVSLLWHPASDTALQFGLKELPGWKLYVGILLVGIGAGLVLYSKEEAESAHPVPRSPAGAVAPDGAAPP
jgi:drug/metabolite transporter (DMT)-like permease